MAVEGLLAGGTGLALGYVVGEAATRLELFDQLPAKLAKVLGAAWTKITVVRFDGLRATTFHDTPAPGVATPADLHTWVAAHARAAYGGGCHVDRVVGGVSERWSLCHVDGPTFVLMRWNREEVTPSALNLGVALIEHAAKVMGHSVLWHSRATDFGGLLAALTPKEWEVLKAMQSSDAEKQIAGVLGLSTHTFHVHVKKIYRKLEVRSRLSLLELCRAIEQQRMMASVSCPETPRAGEVTVMVPAIRMHAAEAVGV